jgi:hypothetical protein
VIDCADGDREIVVGDPAGERVGGFLDRSRTDRSSDEPFAVTASWLSSSPSVMSREIAARAA